MAAFRNIPVWLVNSKADGIIYVDRSKSHATSTWTPGNPDIFGVKIGGADSPVAGTLVGERFSLQLLRQGIAAGLFPLDVNYVVTDRDETLLKYVNIGGKAAWDALIVPGLVKGGISVDTGATGPKSTPGAPGVPPPAGFIPEPAARPAPDTPVPAAAKPVPAPVDQLKAALELNFPGKSDKYVKVIQIINGLGDHPDPVTAITELTGLLGVDMSQVSPYLALVMALFQLSNKGVPK